MSKLLPLRFPSNKRKAFLTLTKSLLSLCRHAWIFTVRLIDSPSRIFRTCRIFRWGCLEKKSSVCRELCSFVYFVFRTHDLVDFVNFGIQRCGYHFRVLLSWKPDVVWVISSSRDVLFFGNMCAFICLIWMFFLCLIIFFFYILFPREQFVQGWCDGVRRGGRRPTGPTPGGSPRRSPGEPRATGGIRRARRSLLVTKLQGE